MLTAALRLLTIVMSRTLTVLNNSILRHMIKIKVQSDRKTSNMFMATSAAWARQVLSSDRDIIVEPLS